MDTLSPQVQPQETADTCTEIPFELVSTASSQHGRVPVCSGVCLPKGRLQESGDWLVEMGGAHLPVQTTVLNRWSDGSIRWMLVRFVASRIAPGRTQGVLIRPARRPQHFAAVTTLRHTSTELQLEIADPHHATHYAAVLLPELFDAAGRRCELVIQDVERPTRGDVCCVFEVAVSCRQYRRINLRLRIEVWPRQGLVQTSLTCHNPARARHSGGLWDLGDEGSVHFGGLHLKIISAQACDHLRWQSEPGIQRTCPADTGVQIIQSGSGSKNWASASHVDHQHRTTVRDRGYTVRSAAGTHRGYRSQPIVSLSGSDTQITVAVPEFWQQFPGSLEAESGVIDVGLFPQACGPYELQGGERKTLSVWTCLSDTSGDPDALQWAHDRPALLQSADWIRQAGVMEWLPADLPTADGKTRRLSAYLHDSLTGTRSLPARRASIDEYGWRNFGDIPADHEQTHYTGRNTITSHYNNQFDLILGGIQNLILSGDTRWFDLFDPLARHVMDVDIYHTEEDRSCFNGGLFWHTDHYVDAATATHRTYSRANASTAVSYGGGPSNEHNYTTGLLYYHFLTGCPGARQAVLSLADWVIGMDDGSATVFGLLDDGPTGLASQTKEEDFHGPGRGVGNSINALLDAWILTGEARYEQHMEQLIRRAVHPRQDCNALQLRDAEKRWSYTVCMTALGRVLTHRLESGRRDELYEYVRRTLENYGRWMADHERPTLSEPDALEFVTEAWAAQDFRKANALRIAAACTDDVRLESRMRARADELNDAAWADLYRFGEQHLTARCLSILMTEGVRDVFHRSCRPDYFPPSDAPWEFADDWTMFVPQKARVRRLLKNPWALLRALPSAFHPQRLIRAVSAIRRQLG